MSVLVGECAAVERLRQGVCVAVLAVAACAGDASSEAESGPEEVDAHALVADASETTLRDPNGTYFASVTANGTGCPEGSWATRISSDGKVFTTTFSEYEADLGPSQAVSVKECQLAIKLHSPSGLSYAVHSFHYVGYAFLEEGVVGRQMANYYFQGAPVTSREVRTDLVGPYDDPYLFSDDIETVDNYVWSPCGVERDLNIVTRVRLQNGTPARSGYMNLSSLDGSSKLVFNLAWRSCEDPQPPASTEPAPSPGATPPVTAQPTPTQPTPTQPTPTQPAPTAPARPGASAPRGGLGGVLGDVGDLLGGQRGSATQPGGVVGGIGGVVGDVVGGLGGVVGGLGDILGLGGLLGGSTDAPSESEAGAAQGQ